MKLLEFLKEARGIVRFYQRDKGLMQRQIRDLEAIVRDRTTIGVDISPSRVDCNHIIVVGRYRNADFVQLYQIQNEDFSHMIERLREMQRYGTVRKVDAMPGFKATVMREL